VVPTATPPRHPVKQWAAQLSRALDDLKVFIPPPIQAIVIKLAVSQRGTSCVVEMAAALIGCAPVARAVPSAGDLSFAEDPEDFRPFYMAHSDDCLFLTDSAARLRAYAFVDDGGMPVRVRDFNGLSEPRGMATGPPALCLSPAARCVQLLDTRPELAAWQLRADDCVALEMAGKAVGVSVRKGQSNGPPAISVAIDEPNGFVYVATFEPQTITQFGATVRTAEEKTAVAGGSTVDLKLTAVRLIDGVRHIAMGLGRLTAIAVLSPSTLLLSHYDRTLQVLTHTAPTSAGAADSKLDGPVGTLRPLSESVASGYSHWHCGRHGESQDLRR
jgi:hypothetical protein